MKHLLFFLVGIVSLSQSANLVRAAAVHAFVVGFWRLLASALIMAALRYWISRSERNSFWESVPKKIAFTTILSGLFFFLHLWTFFLAAQNTTIANCMVIFSTNPIFTALLARFVLEDKFEKRHGIAFSLAFIGIALLFSDRINLDSARFGDGAALVSAFFFSAYLLSGKKSRLHMSTEQYTWIIYSIAALLFFSAGEIDGTVWLGYPTKTWLAIAGTVLIPTLLGHVLISHILKYFNINWISCGKLTEPLFSSLVAYFAFGETLNLITIIAFSFTASSILVLISPLIISKNKNSPTVQDEL